MRNVFHSWMRPAPVSQNYLEPKYLMVVWIGSCWASTLLLCLLYVKLKRILKACCPLHVACCMLHVPCCMLHVGMLHAVCCMLHVACWHAACCMLHVGMLHAVCWHAACCMLHAACCISYAFLPQTETDTQRMLTSSAHRVGLHCTPLGCGPLRREPIALPCSSMRLPPLRGLPSQFLVLHLDSGSECEPVGRGCLLLESSVDDSHLEARALSDCSKHTVPSELLHADHSASSSGNSFASAARSSASWCEWSMDLARQFPFRRPHVYLR